VDIGAAMHQLAWEEDVTAAGPLVYCAGAWGAVSGGYRCCHAPVGLGRRRDRRWPTVIWPLHDIVITNMVWCIAYRREVGRGVVYSPIIVQ